MTLEELKVVISADISQLKKEVEAAKNKINEVADSTKKTSDESKKATSQLAQEFQGLTKKISAAHIVVKLIEEAVKWLVKAIKSGITNLAAFQGKSGNLNIQLTKLKDSITTLTNSLGSMLAPVIEYIIPLLTTAIDKITEFANKIGKAMSGASGNDYFYQATSSIDEYGEAVDEAEKKLLGFDELNMLGNSEEESTGFELQEVDSSQYDGLKAVFEDLQKILEPIFTILDQLGDLLGDIFGDNSESIQTIISQLSGPLVDILNLVSRLLDKMSPAIQSLATLIIDVLTDVSGWVEEIIESITENISDDFLESISNFLKSVFDLIGKIWTVFKPIVNAIVSLLSSGLGKALGTILEILEPIFNTLADIFNLDFESISEEWAGLGDKIKGIWSGFGAWFNEWWTGFKEKISNIGQTIWDTFNTIMSKIFGAKWKDDFVNAWKNVVNWMINGINKVIAAPFKAINTLLTKMKEINILGVKPFDWIKTINIPQIPTLATGGIIDSPTIAMLGEYNNASSNPEIAAPQSLLEDIVNGGNDELISAMIQIGRQIISSIDNKEIDIEIGDDAIAKSAAKGNRAYFNKTGKALFSL